MTVARAGSCRPGAPALPDTLSVIVVAGGNRPGSQLAGADQANAFSPRVLRAVCEIEKAVTRHAGYQDACEPSAGCGGCRFPSSPLRLLPGYSSMTTSMDGFDCARIGEAEALLVAQRTGVCCYLAFLYGPAQGRPGQVGHECGQVGLEQLADTTVAAQCAGWLQEVRGFPWSGDFPAGGAGMGDGSFWFPRAQAVRMEFPLLANATALYDHFLIPLVDEVLTPVWTGNADQAYQLYFQTRRPAYSARMQQRALLGDTLVMFGVISLIYLCMCAHAWSTGLAAMALVMILTSFPLTYGVYVIFVAWFPVMNFVSVFVVMGMAADNVFVYLDTCFFVGPCSNSS